ncbi:FG-GAP repeat domain-containing protein [Yinghuangia aomiensis]
MQAAVLNQWSNWTLGLKADNEDTVDSWTKFDAYSAILSTEVNFRPDVPDLLTTDPATACDGSTVIGDAPLVRLRARGHDPDGGTVLVGFRIWPAGAEAQALGDVTVYSGNVASIDVPASRIPSGTYYWDAGAWDGSLGSAWSQRCTFTIDRTRPSKSPVVTSTKWTSDENTTGTARDTGPVTFAANGVADVTAYEYWTDWDTTSRTVPAPCNGCDASIDLRAPTNGPRNLYVQSRDAGGNRSDITSFSFWANRRNVADRPGDMDGDGKTDLVAVDPTGRLLFYPGNGQGGHDAPITASTVLNMDNGAVAWKNNLITRKGDWNGDDYEDILVRRLDPTTQTQELYIHPGYGTGYVCTSCNTGVQQMKFANSVNHDRVANATSILAIGNVTGDDTGLGIDFPGYQDLLVVSNGQLWLYVGGPSVYLDTFHEPILLGQSGWGSMTLAAPGDSDGDGFPDLWARDNASGVLYRYPGAEWNDVEHGMGVGSTKVVIDSGMPANLFPYILATDANSDGKTDFWGYRTDGNQPMYVTWGSGATGFSGNAQVGYGWSGYAIT